MPRRPAGISTMFDDPQAIELPPAPHPFVAEWIEKDRQVESEAHKEGRAAWLKREDTYMERRKLRISDALFKAAEARGYGLERPAGKLAPVSLRIKDRRVEWTLEEQTSSRQVLLPKKALKKKDNIARGITTEIIRVPTGTFRLVAQVDSGRLKTQISERIHKPFERRIEEVLSRFEKLVEAAIARDIRSAEIQREHKEEIRTKERPRRLNVMEKARWDRLRRQSENWHEAGVLRAFIDNVERALGDGPWAGREVAWLEWARRRVDQMDPLLSGAASARNITRWHYDPDPGEYELSVWELD